MLKAAGYVIKQIVKVAKNATLRAANEGAGKPFPSIAVEGACILSDDAIDALYKAITSRPKEQREQAVAEIAGASEAEIDAAVAQALAEEAPEAGDELREAAAALTQQFRSNAQTLMTAPDARGVSILKPGVTLQTKDDIRRLFDVVPGMLNVGERVAGRFTIVRTLAKGGMGVVYLADDGHMGERVAIKTIRPELSALPQVRSRFIEEARLARRLSHPNIIRVHDAAVDEARKLLFLSMEAIEGESLDDWIKRRPHGCTPDEFMKIAPRVCAAVEYAHTRRECVLHLDLKPSNVMVSADLESVWVLDFGLGQALGDGRANATVLGGTAYAMAPEQIRGERVDQRADVYALGALFFHMLTGEVAVAGMGTAAEERAGVPQVWSDAIAKAMKRRQEDRWASVRDFAGAMSQPTATPSPAPKTRQQASKLADVETPPKQRSAEEWLELGLDADPILPTRGTASGKSDARAAECYRKSAEQGNAFGQCNLGTMYRDGRGVPKDDAKAVEWYRKSAEQGNMYGQYNLAAMYEHGKGVPKNLGQAIRLYELAAAQGHETAAERLKALKPNG